MLLNSEWSRLTICLGVFAGATNICHPPASYPATPACASGGISGAAGTGAIKDMPSALILPSLISGRAGGRSTNIAGTTPAMRSVSAGALPL